MRTSADCGALSATNCVRQSSAGSAVAVVSAASASVTAFSPFPEVGEQGVDHQHSASEHDSRDRCGHLGPSNGRGRDQHHGRPGRHSGRERHRGALPWLVAVRDHHEDLQAGLAQTPPHGVRREQDARAHARGGREAGKAHPCAPEHGARSHLHDSTSGPGHSHLVETRPRQERCQHLIVAHGRPRGDHGFGSALVGGRKVVRLFDSAGGAAWTTCHRATREDAVAFLLQGSGQRPIRRSPMAWQIRGAAVGCLTLLVLMTGCAGGGGGSGARPSASLSISPTRSVPTPTRSPIVTDEPTEGSSATPTGGPSKTDTPEPPKTSATPRPSTTQPSPTQPGSSPTDASTTGGPTGTGSTSPAPSSSPSEAESSAEAEGDWDGRRRPGLGLVAAGSCSGGRDRADVVAGRAGATPPSVGGAAAGGRGRSRMAGA